MGFLAESFMKFNIHSDRMAQAMINDHERKIFMAKLYLQALSNAQYPDKEIVRCKIKTEEGIARLIRERQEVEGMLGTFNDMTQIVQFPIPQN